MRSSTSLPLLLSFALVALALTVSAAPSPSPSAASTPHESAHDQLQKIWSAIQLWLYRLLHGGEYPPGYVAPGTGGGGFSSTVSIPAASTAAFSSLASVAFSSASASVFTSSVAVSTSPIAAVPTSTPTSFAAVPTSTTSASSVSSAAPSASTIVPPPSSNFLALPPSDPTVCSSRSASSFPLSCSSSVTSLDDTCCTTSPGGHLLLTQFWDTGSASTGPNNSWTLHGLWPDNCDGTYEQFCDPSRELTNITAVLEQYQQTDLLAYMDVYWKDYQGNDESFWEHEYNKHGTCISSLEPKCFNNYTPQEEAVYFFRRAVSLYKNLDTYSFLAAANIYPSLTQTYTLDEITKAVEAGFGGNGEANINCKSGVFEEVWYHYTTQGSVVDGDFIPAPLVGSKSTCPATGIKYYPKYTPIPSKPSTTAAGSATGSASVPAPTGNGSSGFLYAVGADGSVPSGTCVISAGAWFKGGTCASFSLTQIIGGSYTLTSSKGLCAVDASTKVLSCASTITSGSQFEIDANGLLTLGGSSAFSASNIPAANEKVNIYKGTSQTLPVTLKFVNK